jgi:hypothetical protein
MADKTKAEIRVSSLLYRAVYSKPIIAQWGKNPEVAQALFEGLREWNISLENLVCNRSPENFGQVEISVQQFLQGRYTFRVGLDAASLSVWNPDWTEISTTKRVAYAGVQSVRQALHIEVASQALFLDIHLSPQGKNRLEVTSKFVPPELKQRNNDFEGYGFMLHRRDRLWHIDLSALFDDALYIRLFRSFNADVSLDEIGSAIQNEEVEFLDYLGLTVPGVP